MRHELKCWPEYMEAILDGRKRFEVRNTTDRAFAVGDTLHLYEWNPRLRIVPVDFRSVDVTVTYILADTFVPAGVCIMGIEPIVPCRPEKAGEAMGVVSAAVYNAMRESSEERAETINKQRLVINEQAARIADMTRMAEIRERTLEDERQHSAKKTLHIAALAEGIRRLHACDLVSCTHWTCESIRRCRSLLSGTTPEAVGLRWTHEPPKALGLYLKKREADKIPTPFLVNQTGPIGWSEIQWCGPLVIAEPEGGAKC